MKNNYNSKSIKILEGLEAVRKRPGMYIGSINSEGMHHLVWEIIDNSIDEVLSGFCNKIKIIINNDNSITISDNGRGIPVDIHDKTKISTLETVFTILHAGGKFDSEIYKNSGGLHGVGASVVNALSSYLKVEVNYNNEKYFMEFFNGGKILKNITNLGITNDKGTCVTFIPDKNIFKENNIFNFSLINNRIKQLAFLNKNLEINITDFRNDEKKFISYKFENGIKDYIYELNKNNILLNKNIFYIKEIEKNILIECSIQYNNTYTENLFSFCNNINTKDGGTHEEGLKQALLKEFNNYNKLLNKNNKIILDKFNWFDIKEGLTCIISIYHHDPQFEGQTKTKLCNLEIRKIVYDVISKNFNSYLLENPDDAKKIIEKINLSLKTRIAAQKAKENFRKKVTANNFSLPGKLSDCEIKNPEIAELYIVEGDSAGGSAKSGRDRKFQAILPLKGKILNVEKSNELKIFENSEILSMINAIGYIINDENNEQKKIRYNKIIIMTDADVDGSHIRILLLTFFYRYMKKIIENGNIYIAQPPLYKIKHGKEFKYLYSDKSLNEIKKKYKENNINNYFIQRYKGLGEMNPDQLWETTMNPKNRILLKVSINDSIEADNICNELMGENVEFRKQFIKNNAKYVKNLDF